MPSFGEAEIGGADLTGLTLLTKDSQPTTAVFAESDTTALDQVQYDLGDGPCLTPFREMRVVSVPDMKAETRWPEVAKRAKAHGVRSSLSAPLIVGESGIGALNFYARADNAL